jgi:hypothetical protein
MAPIANLDEYYCIGVEHDQIELAEAAAPVLREQAQAVLFEMLSGLGFGSVSALLGADALVQLRLSGSG